MSTLHVSNIHGNEVIRELATVALDPCMSREHVDCFRMTVSFDLAGSSIAREPIRSFKR